MQRGLSLSLATFQTISRLKWGRELTVGCPVVVSPLPREWSCLYRRGHPPKSFPVFRNIFKVEERTFSGAVQAMTELTVFLRGGS